MPVRGWGSDYKDCPVEGHCRDLVPRSKSLHAKTDDNTNDNIDDNDDGNDNDDQNNENHVAAIPFKDQNAIQAEINNERCDAEHEHEG